MAATYRQASREITAEIDGSFEEFIASTNRYLAQREELDAARKKLYETAGR
jgi:hypothetical protein